MSNVVDDAARYLASHRVLTLATQGPAGLWAAAVFYAIDEFNFYFLSAPNTRHGQNLSAVPRAAGTIQDGDVTWQEVKGVQLEGNVQRLTDEGREHAIDVYHRRFPFISDAPDPIQRALRAVDWYRLAPDRLYFIDNSRGFGHRDRIL